MLDRPARLRDLVLRTAAGLSSVSAASFAHVSRNLHLSALLDASHTAGGMGRADAPFGALRAVDHVRCSASVPSDDAA